ncbi:MAG: hypothetical protein ACRDBI_04020 [Shewanella sp.]
MDPTEILLKKRRSIPVAAQMSSAAGGIYQTGAVKWLSSLGDVAGGSVMLSCFLGEFCTHSVGISQDLADFRAFGLLF